MSTSEVSGLPPWAQLTSERRAHVGRVVALVTRWSAAIPAADAARCIRAAWLHDAVKDAPMDELRALTPDIDWPDPLRHGPAAARLAARDGETDRAVLDAVAYHSLGHPEWGLPGRLLYMADFLEPGRSFHPPGRKAWVEQVPDAPDDILRRVVAARLAWTLERGRALLPPSVAFWNSLVS